MKSIPASGHTLRGTVSALPGWTGWPVSGNGVGSDRGWRLPPMQANDPDRGTPAPAGLYLGASA
ncbi:MAG: hypothetical protein HQL57_10015 [Magnetococcales bacterium]|nr:hypothetical protein [Magnetococcales bacterium]